MLKQSRHSMLQLFFLKQLFNSMKKAKTQATNYCIKPDIFSTFSPNPTLKARPDL